MEVDNLALDLSRICGSHEFSDVTLVSKDGLKIPGHRQILATRSPYFARMLFGGLREGREEEVRLEVGGRALRLVLEHTYVGRVELGQEEVKVLAELLDQARMMCATILVGNVEEEMRVRLCHAADKEELTKDAVKIINEAVCQKFDDVWEMFFDTMENMWQFTIQEEIFAELSFDALKVVLEVVNESGDGELNDEQKKEKKKTKKLVGDLVAFWMKQSEMNDESKDTIMTLAGLENMSAKTLVDILEMFETPLNVKIVKAMKEKSDENENKIQLLGLEKEGLKKEMKEDKENFAVWFSDCVVFKNDEVITLKAELDTAKDVIEKKYAEIEELIRMVEEFKLNPIAPSPKHNGPPSKRRIFNLVKHVESNVRKCLEIAQTTVNENDGMEYISRDDAFRCSRIMNSADAALTSFESLRDELVTENDKKAWEEIFYTLTEDTIKDMVKAARLLSSTYPFNMDQFFEQTTGKSEEVMSALEALGHICFHYN